MVLNKATGLWGLINLNQYYTVITSYYLLVERAGCACVIGVVGDWLWLCVCVWLRRAAATATRSSALPASTSPSTCR